MTNINEMFQASDEAPDTDTLLGPDQLPTGTVVRCNIVYSKASMRAAKTEQDKGPGKTFLNKLEVTEGEFKGQSFFDSLHLSGGKLDGTFTDGQIGYNKRLFAKLTGAGLTKSFFAANPSDEAIAKALVAAKGDISVKVMWQAPNKDGKVFLDNTTTWSPIDESGGGGGYVPGGAPVTPKGF